MVANNKKTSLYWLVFLIAMIPVVVIPILSQYYHVIFRMPRVDQATIDMSSYNLYSQRSIPLDGLWEFYPEQWIVSDRRGMDAPLPQYSALVMAPKSWKTYPTFSLPTQGCASYRIMLENCAPDVAMVAYIPNITSSYRIYINGELVAKRGEMKRFFSSNPKGTAAMDTYSNLRMDLYNHTFPGGNLEMVIELSSPHIGGLYRTPFLTQWDRMEDATKSRDLTVAGLTGVIVVALASLMMIFFSQGRQKSVFFLLVMDILVLLRILFQNDYLSFFRRHIPVNDYFINSLLQTMILFLPIIFLFCVRELVQIQISSLQLIFMAVYELAFMPAIIICAWQGRPQVQFSFYVVSYLPFLFVLYQTYRSIRNDTRYGLMVHVILVFILSSMMVSAMDSSGFLCMTVSMFPPTGFAVSMLFQLWLYLQRNLDLQHRAMEAENLRLRLRQSETSLMLSQIKPHFLYNTLIAIQVLCKTQPDLAAETVMKFSKFLRANMDFISSHDPIPFEREFEHIRNYTDIEKLRFQKRLEVVFEIGVTNFLVPPLTIQPLVENAIRHGACKKVQGGKVILRTLERDDSFLVEVIDDGEGFVPTDVRQENVPHGLQNLIFRLKEIMNAKVEIHSVPGNGTTICVLLPRETATLHNEEKKLPIGGNKQ